MNKSKVFRAITINKVEAIKGNCKL